MRVLTPRDYRVMPWKNGGGTTTEIYIHPEGAGWNDFEWRVGIADIARSGPFSSFPGIDRSIMLLDCPEGSGMRLTIDGADVELPLRRFLDFKGESVTTGTLLGAPVRDFNVMSRRARVRHACGYAALDSGRALETVDGDWLFAYVVAGLAMLRGDDVGSRALSAGESVLCEGANAVEVLSGREGCQLVWAAFHSIARA